MPCCGSVGGCGARAVSRKTPIYFIIIIIRDKVFKDFKSLSLSMMGETNLLREPVYLDPNTHKPTYWNHSIQNHPVCRKYRVGCVFRLLPGWASARDYIISCYIVYYIVMFLGYCLPGQARWMGLGIVRPPHPKGEFMPSSILRGWRAFTNWPLANRTFHVMYDIYDIW